MRGIEFSSIITGKFDRLMGIFDQVTDRKVCGIL